MFKFQIVWFKSFSPVLFKFNVCISRNYLDSQEFCKNVIGM